jgi:hypothetical protein
MAKKKDEAAAETSGAPAGKITQKEAVKQALAAGKDSPSDGVIYVKEQFGITLNNGAFSTLKTQLRRPPGARQAPSAAGRRAGSTRSASATRSSRAVMASRTSPPLSKH